MAKVVTDDKHYHDIGDAIRAKNGEATQYKPSEMAAAIGAISGGGADFSEVERKLSNGFTDYSYYCYDKSLMTEVPAEILQHTANSKTFKSAFYNCESLEVFTDNFDVQNAESMQETFQKCRKLKSLPILASQNVTNFNQTFSECNKLETIGGIDFSGLSSTPNGTFGACSLLKNIVVNGIIKVSLSFYNSNGLTHDSLMSIINALYDWKANGGTSTYKLTLGSTNLAKLTDAEKAIATEKGWTLA